MAFRRVAALGVSGGLTGTFFVALDG